MPVLLPHGWPTLEGLLSRRFPAVVGRSGDALTYTMTCTYAAIRCQNATVLLREREDHLLVPFSGPLCEGGPTSPQRLEWLVLQTQAPGGFIPEAFLLRKSNFGDPLFLFQDGALLHVRVSRSGSDVRKALPSGVRAVAIPEAVIPDELQGKRLTPQAFVTLLGVYAIAQGVPEATRVLRDLRAVPTP